MTYFSSLWRVSSVCLLLLAINLTTSCRKDDSLVDRRAPYLSPIDPARAPDALGRALSLRGGQLVEGALPAANNPDALRIDNSQAGAVAASGTELYVPFTYVQTHGITGIYLQVKGAKHYWNIPITETSPTQSGNYVFRLGIPRQVLTGEFGIVYCLYNNVGDVGETTPLAVSVEPDKEACSGNEAFHRQGTQGLTTQRILLGDKAGTVRIRYNMYQLPDRMDILYNGNWVASTASTLLMPGENIPSSVCYDGQQGFVSGSDALEFQYNPAASKEFVVYMSGCYGQTLWDFYVDCPDPLACDTLATPPIRHSTNISIPATITEPFTSGLNVEVGDYVFLSCTNFIDIGAASLFNRPSTSVYARGTLGINSEKTYPGFGLGQLLVQQGGQKLGFNALQSDPASGIPLEQTFVNYIFSGEDGLYFIAKQTGVLTFEINDKNPSDNVGAFVVEAYVMPKSVHENRNCYNKCPLRVPSWSTLDFSYIDNKGRKWNDGLINDGAIEDFYHGAANDDYRGASPVVQGCQCVYNHTSGNLVNDENAENQMGTFDFGKSVFFVNSDRMHYILDVFPHLAYRNTTTNPAGFRYHPTPPRNTY